MAETSYVKVVLVFSFDISLKVWFTSASSEHVSDLVSQPDSCPSVGCMDHGLTR